MGQKQEALDYYEEALTIYREVEDRGGEGTTLHNIGWLYFNIERYDGALAYCQLAKLLFIEVQSPSGIEHVEQGIGAIRQKVGERQFATLFPQVQARAAEIVEQALRDGLK